MSILNISRVSKRQSKKPRLGMVLAFSGQRGTAVGGLVDVPARVVYIWPRFRSGDYLVTLEYAQPVRNGKAYLRQIDAFVSELYQPAVHGNTDQGHF